MTPKQKDFLLKLIEWNIIVYALIGFLVYLLPPLQDQLAARPQAVALQPTSLLSSPTPSPTSPPTSTPTITPTPTLVIQPIAPPPIIARPPVRAAQVSTSPSNPGSPADAWQTIRPHSSIWYKIGNGGDHIDAFLEANPLDGMSMQVYAPGNLDQPIGQGTFQWQTRSLVWAGGKWNSAGDWVARINNDNTAPAQYKLTTSTFVIGKCDSISYWEKLHGQDVLWTACK
jgi:hypothetical protein